MKKHWFTLYTDTFLWMNNHCGIVYNTKNKQQFIFKLSNKLEKICHQLLIIENLYTVELTEEYLNDNEINQWIRSLVNIQAGYLSYNIKFEKRPVSLKPILKVQNKAEYYELNHNKNLRGQILQNLHELTFYINSSEYGSDEFFKQHIYPLKECQTLDCSKILSFISNSRNLFLSKINFVGNLFSYPDFETFINNISNLSIQCTIYIMMPDLINNIHIFKNIHWHDNIKFNILIDPNFDISLIRLISFTCSVTVFVLSKNDYIHCVNIFKIFPKQNIRIIPLYNKENISFFESNIFIDKNDLENIDLSKNEVFMRQVLNIIDFGRLTVMPNGNVYDNVNTYPLGTIQNSPYSLVYKEFCERKSWFKIRNQEPCCSCIFQWLCPSPSNYEIIIGRSNLCHINSNK